MLWKATRTSGVSFSWAGEWRVLASGQWAVADRSWRVGDGKRAVARPRVAARAAARAAAHLLGIVPQATYLIAQIANLLRENVLIDGGGARRYEPRVHHRRLDQRVGAAVRTRAVVSVIVGRRRRQRRGEARG